MMANNRIFLFQSAAKGSLREFPVFQYSLYGRITFLKPYFFLHTEIPCIFLNIFLNLLDTWISRVIKHRFW